MAVKIDYEGHTIEMRNRLNDAALFIDGQQVAVSGGSIHSELDTNLPDGRLVVVKVSSSCLRKLPCRGWVNAEHGNRPSA